MKVHNIVGVLTLNRRDFLESIKEFKTLRDIAEEAEDYNMKLQAFSMLGLCY